MIDVAQNKAPASPCSCHKMVSFTEEGDKPALRTMISQHWSILNVAKDWKIVADFKGDEQYPRIKYEYKQHPNIVVWSESLMVIIIIELTVPFESQITESHEYKMAKYENLCGHICTHRHEANLYAVEVGARGSLDSHCGLWQADLG